MATSLLTALSSFAAAIPGIPGNSTKQGFANVISMSNDKDLANISGSQLFTFIIVFLISVWLLMFIGALIFNSSIPRIFPSVRKITMLEFFGLYLVCHILFT